MRTAMLWSIPVVCTAALALAAPPPPPPPPVSFTNDLLPIFTKLGCNQGACHGQQSGKGGFKLSLRAWDPAFDFEQITKADNGRRVKPSDPTLSLLLLKPLGRVPHGGGALLVPYSEDYKTVHRWLCEGRKGPDEQKDAKLTELTVSPTELSGPGTLTVTARYSDGSTRDVTRLARYTSQNDGVAQVSEQGKITPRGSGEATILVAYSGEVKVATVLVPYRLPSPLAPLPTTAPSSRPLWERGTSSRAPLSPKGSEERRDVGRGAGGEGTGGEGGLDPLVQKKLTRLGLTPSPRCTDSEFLRRVYLDLTASLPTPQETRRFLDSPDPQKRAKLIDKLLESEAYVDYRTLKLADLLRVNGQFLSEEGADTYYRWIHEQVENNVGYDKFAFALLTGKGSTYHVGAANYCRVAQTPEDLTETTASTFLGTRISCAKCHNHPFEGWKQQDYYDFAAFFARYGRKYGPEFGEEQVYVRRDGEIANPRNKQVAKMRFLGTTKPVEGEPFPDRRETLATWLTGKDNRQFARVAANRIWADFFGRGIVEPVDDFRLSNPPCNPELLEALTDSFIASGYDTKQLIRRILNSDTYQRSSQILPGNAADTKYFARAYPRRLPAEALLDTIGQVTGKQERFWPYPEGVKAIQIRDSRQSAYFLEIFGRPKREIVCGCERSPQPNLAQSLHLVNSWSINDKLASGATIARLLKDFEPWAKPLRDRRIIEELYFLTLCRAPSKAEAESLVAHVQKQKDRKQGFEDALWALLNSEEFLFQK